MRSAPRRTLKLVYRFSSQLLPRRKALSVTRRFYNQLKEARTLPRGSKERVELAHFIQRIRHTPIIRSC